RSAAAGARVRASETLPVPSTGLAPFVQPARATGATRGRIARKVVDRVFERICLLLGGSRRASAVPRRDRRIQVATRPSGARRQAELGLMWRPGSGRRSVPFRVRGAVRFLLRGARTTTGGSDEGRSVRASCGRSRRGQVSPAPGPGGRRDGGGLGGAPPRARRP